MDSWHSAYQDATGAPAAFASTSNLPGQPGRPLNSHTSVPPAVRQNGSRKHVPEDWDAHKAEITQLYDKGTLESVRVFMKERHGLDATVKQYKDRIRKWGLDKKIKTAEMKAMIRKREERASISNKASAFRVRKRPVPEAKITRYIHEHPKRPSSDGDVDVDMDGDSAATPAGLSVYTPSNTGPRTPTAAPSPQGISNEYTAASPQRSLSFEAQNANLYRSDSLDGQIPDPPSIRSNPALFSNPSTPRPHTTLDVLASSVSITLNSQPASPALSISSIIRSTSTFTGQSPAMTPRTLPIFPQNSSQFAEGFQEKARPFQSNLSSAVVWTQTDLHVAASTQSRYRQSEEEQLWEELLWIKFSHGESDSEYLDRSTKIAIVLHEQGRYKSAEELIQRSISAYKLENRDDVHKLNALNILGEIFRAQGFYTKAEKVHKRTLRSKTDLLGSEHPNTLISMRNLASIYCRQGLWKEAEDLDVQVMETRKRVLGQEHPDTLLSISNLAVAYGEQARWKEAEDLQEQVLETRKRVLGQEHPDTLMSMGYLATTYWQQRHLREAEDLEVQVMEMRKRVLGQEHPDTLMSMSNLASTYWSQRRWNEAEDLQEQVLETQKRVLGQEHPDTLISMSNLASTYWSQRRWKEAEALEVQVMETRKRVLGQEHPHTLESMYNLGCTWKSLGRYGDALKLMHECVQLRIRILGADHSNTLNSKEVLLDWQSEGLEANASTSTDMGMYWDS
ncbi:hypothetical protein EG329_000282 [Mollisiaceae sp. DMI_Dod_QoI]|nr:hypothetical protein EG329_000282 [Helotiales sp. DMI_Dod_QoI]